MSELLPDGWHLQEQEAKCCHQQHPTRRGPVTDILVWVECFASMVAVLSTKYPDKIPQLMAYQRTIVRASKCYIKKRWITYDTCYCRNAAVTKSLDWGQVDFSLYNKTFTGRAIQIDRCKHCFSEHHKSEDCVFATGHAYRNQRQCSPIRIQRQRSPIRLQRQRSPMQSVEEIKEPCKLFNTRYGNKCRYNPCKYQHVGSSCGEDDHSRYYCDRDTPQVRRAKNVPGKDIRKK